MEQPHDGGARDRTHPATDPAMPFGALLRRLRVLAGLTQEQLAERAGLSARAVGDLERDGARRPRLDTAVLLAGALGLEGKARREFLVAAHPEAATPETAGPPSASAGVAATPESPAPTTAPSLLLEPLTPLFGREREEAALLHLLAHSRLLTLTGPGGVGKTRLALRLAALARAQYAAVHVVALAAVRDPALVLSAIAAALDVRDTAQQTPAGAIAAAVGESRTLLVLDNLEHVLAAGPQVQELLATCPALTVLATSRAPLRLRGEQEFAVGPLALPPEEAELETIAQSPAVQLFVQGARGLRPDFTLDERTGPLVGAICRRVDGLPLAIELAAARTRLLPPGALLDRLERRLEILREGSHDLPERQRTMRATIAWSYDLLEPEEQALFRRLAVFAGGAGLEAVAAVSGEVPAAEVEERIERLAEQSLVGVGEGTDGAIRVRLLETIREYAWEKLEESGDVETVLRRFAAYYLALAEEGEIGLKGAEQATWLERLEQEHDNLRAVLRTAAANGDLDVGLRLAGALYPFWEARGPLHEGRYHLDELVTRAAQGDMAQVGLPVLAKALDGAGRLAIVQGDYVQAAEYYARNLDVNRALRDTAGVAAALNGLGNAAFYQADLERATAMYRESLALRRDLGDRRGVAASLNNLGNTALMQGDLEGARPFLEESLSIHRQMGNAALISISLANLGAIAVQQDDYVRAVTLLEEAASRQRGLVDRKGLAITLSTLGEALRRQGLLERARTALAESLALARDLGIKRDVVVCLVNLAAIDGEQGKIVRARTLCGEGLAVARDINAQDLMLGALDCMAYLAYAEGRNERAIEIYGAVTTHRGAMGFPRSRRDSAEVDPVLQALRHALGERQYAAAWSAGSAISLDRAVAYALNETAIMS